MGFFVMKNDANKDSKKRDKYKALLIHKSREVFNKIELC